MEPSSEAWSRLDQDPDGGQFDDMEYITEMIYCLAAHTHFPAELECFKLKFWPNLTHWIFKQIGYYKNVSGQQSSYKY